MFQVAQPRPVTREPNLITRRSTIASGRLLPLTVPACVDTDGKCLPHVVVPVRHHLDRLATLRTSIPGIKVWEVVLGMLLMRKQGASALQGDPGTTAKS